MTQMARRLSWVDPAFQLQVCTFHTLMKSPMKSGHAHPGQ